MAKTTIPNLYDLLSKVIIANDFRSLRMSELRRVIGELLSRQSPDLLIASNIFSHHVEMSLLTRQIPYILEIERGDRKIRGVGFSNDAIQEFATAYLGGNIHSPDTRQYLDDLYEALAFSNFANVKFDNLKVLNKYENKQEEDQKGE